MKTNSDWVAQWRSDCDLNTWRYDEPLLKILIGKIQADSIRSALSIADTFALDHKLSAPEVIIAIQIRDAIERLVEEIEQ